jgi:hypothetical protein
MVTLLRRLFWLALLGGGGFAGWSLWQRQQQAAPAAPEWPPLDTNASTRSSTATATATTVAAPAAGRPESTSTAPARSAPSAPESTTTGAAGSTTGAASSAGAKWVAPVDGACPDGYPVKANDNSGIYHVPGGRFYSRTVPERCYAVAGDAETDGYRAAKA